MNGSPFYEFGFVTTPPNTDRYIAEVKNKEAYNLGYYKK